MLGIIADDLTGAGDASVQFAKRGWRTLLTSLAPQDLAEAGHYRRKRWCPALSRTTVIAVTNRLPGARQRALRKNSPPRR